MGEISGDEDGGGGPSSRCGDGKHASGIEGARPVDCDLADRVAFEGGEWLLLDGPAPCEVAATGVHAGRETGAARAGNGRPAEPLKAQPRHLQERA